MKILSKLTLVLAVFATVFASCGKDDTGETKPSGKSDYLVTVSTVSGGSSANVKTVTDAYFTEFKKIQGASVYESSIVINGVFTESDNLVVNAATRAYDNLMKDNFKVDDDGCIWVYISATNKEDGTYDLYGQAIGKLPE